MSKFVRRRSLMLFLALVALGPVLQKGALAQRRQSSKEISKPGCQLTSGGESTVLDVAGGQTLRLADGRFVRLTEILVPSIVAGFDPSAGAQAFLRSVALGKKVEVKFGGAQRDRYGVYAAHLEMGGEPLWLQQGLVSAGLAEVFPQPDNHACASELLPAEAAAREEKRGLWGLAYFKVLKAKDTRSIFNLMQTYQIVEGTVDHAMESGDRTILFFTAQKKFSFTAVIEAAAKRKIDGKKNADNWDGQAVRVRGWVESKRGPAIIVTQSEQLEFIASATKGDQKLGAQ